MLQKDGKFFKDKDDDILDCLYDSGCMYGNYTVCFELMIPLVTMAAKLFQKTTVFPFSFAYKCCWELVDLAIKSLCTSLFYFWDYFSNNMNFQLKCI